MPEDSEKLDQNKRICPCCGQATLTRIPQLSQDILDYYISCIMTGQPFTRQYKAYDGKIKITVSNFTDKLSNHALKAVDYIGKSTLDVATKQTAKYITHRLLVIPSITINNKGQGRVFKVQQQVIKAIETMLQNTNYDSGVQTYIQTITSSDICTGLPAKLLDQVTKYHADLLNSLVDRGFDQSFCASIQFS